MGIRALDLSLSYEAPPNQDNISPPKPRALNYRRAGAPAKPSPGRGPAASGPARPRLDSLPPPGEIWVSNHKLRSRYTLRAALAEVAAFLHEHPSEFVMISFGRDPELDASWR